MTRLSEPERAGFLQMSPDWKLDGESITRTYVLTDFNEALGFVVRLGVLSELADHHPDIDIRWNKVTLTLSTHSEQALTALDTNLATAIDALITT
jgi:4a-hydroxytetrahydrobiopterin dehydratase